ncbi:rRNA maturation RNase YbeY [Pricia antarctica]|uniref:Endoribonuclease YbeY n=1 Tax=Pricia antarctica TaxID=641691 RepID=A0A1G6X4F7_9FLAO|nr:rRNA maturation RNase YbeY [Pricia antarctica]SDD72979.1 rRNA maturation RNase YbeY [Pricia antarctica]
MIEFHYESDFLLDDETKFADWISRVVGSEGGTIKQLDYIFCSDNYLLDMNKKYLFHDTFTDIITFDYSVGKQIGGDIFISVDRVKENAIQFEIHFEEELLRVMAHGLLHLFGYTDKTETGKAEMRGKEDEKIKLFHVEQ